MHIHPGGRAAYLLSRHLPTRRAEDFFDHPCVSYLQSDVHAHIDYEGNYITGFCSGLRIGENSARDMAGLFREGIALSQYPILGMLINGGLEALHGYAIGQGYAPAQSGYVSGCHLCLDMRIFLYFRDQKFRELYPAFFYEELGRMRGFAALRGEEGASPAPQ
jgi:hypothetical protein